MKLRLKAFLFLMPILTACAPINTKFTCNATAGDRCLSIEEVNAMTEEKDSPIYKKETTHRVQKPVCRTCNKVQTSQTQTIWLAPWKDEEGRVHENDTLFASIAKDNQKTT